MFQKFLLDYYTNCRPLFALSLPLSSLVLFNYSIFKYIRMLLIAHFVLGPIVQDRARSFIAFLWPHISTNVSPIITLFEH